MRRSSDPLRGAEREMLKKTRLKTYYILGAMWFIVAIIVAFFIIHFTGEPASVSTETSKGLLRRIFDLFGIEYNDVTVRAYNHYIRKLAHFVLFFAFGFSLRATTQYQHHLPKTRTALIIGWLFGIGDEVRQRFIPGRAASIKDALIDFSGVVVGTLAAIGVFRLVAVLRQKRRAKEKSDGGTDRQNGENEKNGEEPVGSVNEKE